MTASAPTPLRLLSPASTNLSADDAAALNAFVTAATTGTWRGPMELGGGKHRWDSTITLPLGTGGFRFDGQGQFVKDPLLSPSPDVQNQTVVYWNGSAGGTMIQTTGQLGLSMKNLTLSGQKTTGANRAGVIFSSGYDVTAASANGLGTIEACSFMHAAIEFEMGSAATDDDGADFAWTRIQSVDIDVCLKLHSNQNVNFNNSSRSYLNCGASVLGLQGGHFYTRVGDWFGCGFGNAATTSTITAKIDNGSGGAGNLLTVTAHSGANLAVGMSLTGASVLAGTFISSLGTGTGGNGTYNLTSPAAFTQNVSSESMTAGYYVHSLMGMADNSEVVGVDGGRIEGGTQGFANLQGGQAHAIFTNLTECQSDQNVTQFVFAGVMAEFIGGRFASNDATNPFAVCTTGAGNQMGGMSFKGAQFDGGVTTWTPGNWFGRGFGAARTILDVEGCTYGANGKILQHPNQHSHITRGDSYQWGQTTTSGALNIGIFGTRVGYWDETVVPSDATTVMEATIAGRKSDGSALAVWSFRVTVNNIGGDFGTTTISEAVAIGAPLNAPGYTAPTFNPGSGSIFVTVTGHSTDTINWGATFVLKSPAVNP